MSIQTNSQLKTLIDDHEIVMVPFRPEQINNGSVDISLGRYIARIKDQYGVAGSTLSPITISPNKQTGSDVFDIEDLTAKGSLILKPFERVLAHSHEFIGSRKRTLPEMRAKSSMARWGMTVALCAGWGDVGYMNRWCLEIINLNPCSVSIKVGTLIGQVVFHVVDEPEEGTIYSQPGVGQYQQGDDIEKLMAEWKPEMILPKPMKVKAFEPVCPADKV